MSAVRNLLLRERPRMNSGSQRGAKRIGCNRFASRNSIYRVFTSLSRRFPIGGAASLRKFLGRRAFRAEKSHDCDNEISRYATQNMSFRRAWFARRNLQPRQRFLVGTNRLLEMTVLGSNTLCARGGMRAASRNDRLFQIGNGGAIPTSCHHKNRIGGPRRLIKIFVSKNRSDNTSAMTTNSPTISTRAIF